MYTIHKSLECGNVFSHKIAGVRLPNDGLGRLITRVCSKFERDQHAFILSRLVGVDSDNVEFGGLSMKI